MYIIYVNNTLPLAHEISRHFWAAYDLTWKYVSRFKSKLDHWDRLYFHIQQHHNHNKFKALIIYCVCFAFVYTLSPCIFAIFGILALAASAVLRKLYSNLSEPQYGGPQVQEEMFLYLIHK